MSHQKRILIFAGLLAVIEAGLLQSTLFAQIPACAPYPGCLYAPGPPVPFSTTTNSITYNDTAGLPRTINVAIRIPSVPAGPLPVVVWSHGGASGQSNPLTAMSEWSEVTARAGYLTISIAHTSRTQPERQALCTALGVAVPTDCEFFKYLNWDRPYDIRNTLDEIVRQNAGGPLQGRIDLARIAVGGHSAGSGGALSIAGAARLFTPVPPPSILADPRPAAFLAFSPQGPGSEGFFETDFRQPSTSWDGINRPVLIASGDGDNTCGMVSECLDGDTPFRRQIAFERMMPGNKFQVYLKDTDTYHGFFGSLSNNCVAKGVAAAKCAAFESWLSATAVAFLDAKLRGIPAAQFWLANGLIEVASGGIAQWKAK